MDYSNLSLKLPWGGVLVTVYKSTTQKTTKEIILELLAVNNKLTREELAKEIGVTSDTIKQHIAKLQKEKKLSRIGGRKDGFWKIINKMEDK